MGSRLRLCADKILQHQQREPEENRHIGTGKVKKQNTVVSKSGSQWRKRWLARCRAPVFPNYLIHVFFFIVLCIYLSQLLLSFVWKCVSTRFLFKSGSNPFFSCVPSGVVVPGEEGTLLIYAPSFLFFCKNSKGAKHPLVHPEIYSGRHICTSSLNSCCLTSGSKRGSLWN